MRRPFADAFVMRCFAFQPSTAQQADGQRDKPNLMLFPPTESGAGTSGRWTARQQHSDVAVVACWLGCPSRVPAACAGLSLLVNYSKIVTFRD